MKKTYLLKNLNCAHCAAKIQDAIGKIEGVKEVQINFMTTKMILEADSKEYDEILEKAKKIIKKYEPKVIVSL